MLDDAEIVAVVVVIAGMYQGTESPFCRAWTNGAWMEGVKGGGARSTIGFGLEEPEGGRRSSRRYHEKERHGW